MKGTRLWQAPRSPIIQGRSRSARPFWEVWAAGVLLAEVVVFVVGIAFRLLLNGSHVADAVPLGLVFALAGLPGAMAGAGLGAWLAQAMGWRQAAVSASVTGTVLAFGTILLIQRAFGWG